MKKVQIHLDTAVVEKVKVLIDEVQNLNVSDPENWGWKLIFRPDGDVELWHGRHGVIWSELNTEVQKR